MPMIEVVNGRDMQESGARYKVDARRMQKELEEWDKERPTVLKESDDIIADAIEDPAFKLNQIMEKFKLDSDSEDDE